MTSPIGFAFNAVLNARIWTVAILRLPTSANLAAERRLVIAVADLAATIPSLIVALSIFLKAVTVPMILARAVFHFTAIVSPVTRVRIAALYSITQPTSFRSAALVLVTATLSGSICSPSFTDSAVTAFCAISSCAAADEFFVIASSVIEDPSANEADAISCCLFTSSRLATSVPRIPAARDPRRFISSRLFAISAIPP